MMELVLGSGLLTGWDEAMHEAFEAQQDCQNILADGIQRWSGRHTFVALECSYECLPAMTFDELSEDFQEDVLDGARIDALVYCRYTGSVLAAIAEKSSSPLDRRSAQLQLIRRFATECGVPLLELPQDLRSASEVFTTLSSQFVFPEFTGVSGDIELLRCPHCFEDFEIQVEKGRFGYEVRLGFEKEHCGGTRRHPTNLTEKEALDMIDRILSTEKWA